LIATSRELEPVAAPKAMQFPVAMQAAHDSENLYIRLNFKSPADAGAKADKEEKSPMHEVEAAIMMAGPKIDMGSQVGCWATCHGDVGSMPGADPKKKKHVKDANVANGIYYDYIQWKSGEAGVGATQVDKTIHRFHHVSPGYTLGLGANANVKASQQ